MELNHLTKATMFQAFIPRHLKKLVGVINTSEYKKKARIASCKKCSKTFSNKKELWRHIKENE
jgi:hypothetical protein